MKSIGSCRLFLLPLSGVLISGVAAADPPESLVTLPAPVEQTALHPAAGHPFDGLAGSWTGGGSIALAGDIKENLRCRASYNHAQGSNSLALSIRCASDNYKFELSSNVVERNGQLSGRWSETSYNVSGSISGRVAGNRISATAKGESFNANLTVTTNGNRQSVSIVPQANYITNVQIALSRR